MSDFVIVTDSTTDLSGKMIADMELELVNLKFVLDGKTYENTPDGGEISSKTFYSKLRTGSTSTTTQVNVEEFVECFESILKRDKDILYIGFSSGLSGTYQSSLIAKEELAEKYPGRKIYLFDSLCASLGEGLLVYTAVQLKKSGKDINHVLDWLKLNALNLCHWFTVDDLHHLKRGGRVSAATAVVGTMLGIKPVLHVDNEGHLISMEKVRGRRQALDTLVKKMEETATNPSEQTIFICHGDCFDDAKYVADLVKAKFKPKNIVINFIGPVIGAHAGPGTVGLFFMGTHR